MHYKELAGLPRISMLGFGCMRFPVIDGKNDQIDEPEAHRMLDYAFDHGVTYFDTAYNYHGGNSESVVGRWIQSRSNRDQIVLVTKNPVWLAKTHEDFTARLEEQLERLGTDHIDLYICHSLDKKSWDAIVRLDIFSFLDREKKRGRIGRVGFSFHDEYPVFEEILTCGYPWDFCQIQLNYLDGEYQAGLRGLELARSRGVDVVVMEPVKGGKLAKEDAEIRALLEENKTAGSMASLALRWVWSQPGVLLLLSGMSTMEQVRENIETADRFRPLSEQEQQAIEAIRKYFQSRQKNDCTACEYCLPCPAEVNIPGIFSAWNNAAIFRDEKAKARYHAIVEEGHGPEHCISCGHCESMCPQQIPVIEDLVRAAEDFEANRV